MKSFIIYNDKGEIIRVGSSQNIDYQLQAQNDEFVMDGTADCITQKIEFDGFDEKGQPINPRVVNKTPAEIEADNPAPIPLSLEKQPAHITNEQWQGILNRLDNLEAK